MEQIFEVQAAVLELSRWQDFVQRESGVLLRYPQYLEAPHSVEPRDNCLHQSHGFFRCMRLANSVDELLAVTYEKGLVVVVSPRAATNDPKKRLLCCSAASAFLVCSSA